MSPVRKTATLLSIVAMMATATATEVSLYLDAASAYVFRGATFNKGAVLQPGLEVEAMKFGDFEIPITLGVWGNLDLEKVTEDETDEAGTTVSTTVAESGMFSELNLYASLALPSPVDILEWSIGYVEYLYPQAGGEPDREISLAFSLDTLLAPAVTLSHGVDGEVKKSTFVEFELSHELELADDLSLELTAILGYAAPDEGKSGFNNLDLSVALSWKAVTVSLAHIAQVDDKVLVDAEDGGLYDVEWVGMVSLSHTF